MFWIYHDTLLREIIYHCRPNILLKCGPVGQWKGWFCRPNRKLIIVLHSSMLKVMIRPWVLLFFCPLAIGCIRTVSLVGHAMWLKSTTQIWCPARLFSFGSSKPWMAFHPLEATDGRRNVGPTHMDFSSNGKMDFSKVIFIIKVFSFFFSFFLPNKT